MELNIGQREYILEMLLTRYTIPDEYKTIIKEAIKKFATNKGYDDSTIDKMVSKTQSLADSICGLRENNLSLFDGKVAEWLACMEYNGLKNKGNIVMTIINPDPTSKADLLHIAKVNGAYVVYPGADVKCGGAKYLIEQWEKIVRERYDIPLLDIEGCISTDNCENKLTPSQRERFKKLKEQYPNKRPIKSQFNRQEVMIVAKDFLKYIDDGSTPSMPSDKPFVSSKESRERLQMLLSEMSEANIPIKAWNNFKDNSKEVFNAKEEYQSKMTKEKEEKAKAEAERSKAKAEEQARAMAETNRQKSNSRVKNERKESYKERKEDGFLSKLLRASGKAIEGIAHLRGYDNKWDMIKDDAVNGFTRIIEIGVERVLGYNQTDSEDKVNNSKQSASNSERGQGNKTRQSNTKENMNSSSTSLADEKDNAGCGAGTPKSPHSTKSYERTRNGKRETVRGYTTGEKNSKSDAM